MLRRRLAAPALLLCGAALAGCKGEPVAATTPNALTSERRADLAMQLVDAAGTSDGAAGAGLAASVIMSGAQVSRVTATRAGFAALARVGDTKVAANVAANVAATTGTAAGGAEGAVYNVIAFQMIETAFRDTIMGMVAWDVTPSGHPTSFVVAYSFGEGTGHFDDVDGGPTAYAYVFKSSQASWTRLAMPSSADLPQARGSYAFLLPTSPSTFRTPS